MVVLRSHIFHFGSMIVLRTYFFILLNVATWNIFFLIKHIPSSSPPSPLPFSKIKLMNNIKLLDNITHFWSYCLNRLNRLYRHNKKFSSLIYYPSWNEQSPLKLITSIQGQFWNMCPGCLLRKYSINITEILITYM